MPPHRGFGGGGHHGGGMRRHGGGGGVRHHGGAGMVRHGGMGHRPVGNAGMAHRPVGGYSRIGGVGGVGRMGHRTVVVGRPMYRPMPFYPMMGMSMMMTGMMMGTMTGMMMGSMMARGGGGGGGGCSGGSKTVIIYVNKQPPSGLEPGRTYYVVTRKDGSVAYFLEPPTDGSKYQVITFGAPPQSEVTKLSPEMQREYDQHLKEYGAAPPPQEFVQMMKEKRLMEERGIVTYMAGAPPEGVSPNTIYYVVKQSDGQETFYTEAPTDPNIKAMKVVFGMPADSEMQGLTNEQRATWKKDLEQFGAAPAPQFYFEMVRERNQDLSNQPAGSSSDASVPSPPEGYNDQSKQGRPSPQPVLVVPAPQPQQQTQQQHPIPQQNQARYQQQQVVMQQAQPQNRQMQTAPVMLPPKRIEPGAPMAQGQPWAIDETVNQCTSCKAVFGTFKRKHHCRRCGNIFCDDCTPHAIALPIQYYHDPVRVCQPCLETEGAGNKPGAVHDNSSCAIL